MRAVLLVALVLMLFTPQVATAEAEERRLERRYDGPTDPMGLRVLETPSCSASADGSGDGVGGACWLLRDEPAATVRIVLEDDVFGALPSEYWVERADGSVMRGLFCGQVELALPAGASFIAVFADAHTPARTSCGMNLHGLHTTGTVTVTWLSG